MSTRILVINPGSTSTKIAIYDDKNEFFSKAIEHSKEQISKYMEISDQFEMRKNCILTELSDNNIQSSSINVIISRGGLLPPVSAGAYEVNEEMVYQLKYHPQNEHASNLGAQIALYLANKWHIKAYVYDPVTVDELIPITKVTGLPEMKRKGMGHNLNMRASAIRYAKSIDRPYNELNLVVTHLGGGITLTLHRKGRMVDMISDDEGPFSPERAGGLPIFQVINMITSNNMSQKDAMRIVQHQGGLNAYLKTTDAREVEAMIKKGSERAELIYHAMALNVAKNIAKLAVVVSGKVDAIILTGGMAYSKMLTDWIRDYVKFIAPVKIIAGENEMEALAFGVLRVVTGEEKAKIFSMKNISMD
ncbi:MAG: butyrate kinase [Methanobacterium paludis]|nr:butyrate kinase [Methanobacterium paludis]